MTVTVTVTVIGTHPARLDLYVHAGDPIDFGIPVLDETSAAEDIDSWACAATVTGPAGELLHDFTPTIVEDMVRVVATSTVTATWAWACYAARMNVTVTPPGGGPAQIATGWIRLYRP